MMLEVLSKSKRCKRILYSNKTHIQLIDIPNKSVNQHRAIWYKTIRTLFISMHSIQDISYTMTTPIILF